MMRLIWYSPQKSKYPLYKHLQVKASKYVPRVCTCIHRVLIEGKFSWNILVTDLTQYMYVKFK